MQDDYVKGCIYVDIRKKRFSASLVFRWHRRYNPISTTWTTASCHKCCSILQWRTCSCLYYIYKQVSQHVLPCLYPMQRFSEKLCSKIALWMCEAKWEGFTVLGIRHPTWFVLNTSHLSYLRIYSFCVGLRCSQSASTRILAIHPLYRCCFKDDRIPRFRIFVTGTNRDFRCLLGHHLWTWISWSTKIG